jgi:hypothetical protein
VLAATRIPAFVFLYKNHSFNDYKKFRSVLRPASGKILAENPFISGVTSRGWRRGVNADRSQHVGAPLAADTAKTTTLATIVLFEPHSADRFSPPRRN